MRDAWLYAAATILTIWALAHLFPGNTRAVVAGFEPITTDNRRVITMEWINEGLTLLFIAALVVGAALGGEGDFQRVVLWIVVVMLNVMSAVSLATGFRIDFIAYRLCPVIFTGSSLLIIAGMTL